MRDQHAGTGQQSIGVEAQRLQEIEQPVLDRVAVLDLEQHQRLVRDKHALRTFAHLELMALGVDLDQ